MADELPLKIATAAWELVNGDLRDAPRGVGKPLRSPYSGQWVARRSTYRVRYRIDEGERTVVVLDIRGRADAYHYSGGR
jgi:mRNA interferase RelE/StbE